jgi:hypothetical protein
VYHASAGLFFERTEQGEVRVVKTAGGAHPGEGEAGRVVCDVLLAPGVWASVMSSMSRLGETSDGFAEALDFHNGNIRG